MCNPKQILISSSNILLLFSFYKNSRIFSKVIIGQNAVFIIILSIRSNFLRFYNKNFLPKKIIQRGFGNFKFMENTKTKFNYTNSYLKRKKNYEKRQSVSISS